MIDNLAGSGREGFRVDEYNPNYGQKEIQTKVDKTDNAMLDKISLENV